jgi:nitrogen fixation protein FixH
MVSENYYEQELKYQDRINAVNRAVNCGVTITSDASKKSVVIALPAVQVAQNISGSIQLYRPSAPALDQKVRLEPKADGTQRLDTSRLAAGLWVVRVKWVAGGENYFLEQKITGAGK